MTMIPVDYHTCFIAISPHAKILYANEAMASLLGRKDTEISNKMSLPQLMTVPCQQLHQNFFKVSAPVCCSQLVFRTPVNIAKLCAMTDVAYTKMKTLLYTIHCDHHQVGFVLFAGLGHLKSGRAELP